jgi:hypothetical protein
MPPTVLPVNLNFLNRDTASTVNAQTQPRNFATDFVNFARQQKLSVCWMGIQEMVQPTCDPQAVCGCDTFVPEVEDDRIAKARKRKSIRPERRERRRRQMIVEDLR